MALEEDGESFGEPMGAPGSGREGIPGNLGWKQDGSELAP